MFAFQIIRNLKINKTTKQVRKTYNQHLYNNVVLSLNHIIIQSTIHGMAVPHSTTQHTYKSFTFNIIITLATNYFASIYLYVH